MKITLKALKDMLTKTLFIKSFLTVVIDKLYSNKDTERIFVTYRKYTVQMSINYDVSTIYIHFIGEVDNFDVSEWLHIRDDLKNLLGW